MKKSKPACQTLQKIKIQKHTLLLRHLTLDDYDNIAVLMEHGYGNLGGAWKRDQYASQVTRCPQGQIVIEDNGQLVAAALSMTVDYARFGDVHTYAQITGLPFNWLTASMCVRC